MAEFHTWMYWVGAGIICIIIEIFDPAFFFLSLGVGAIITGILSSLGFVNRFFFLQVLIFAIVSFLTFLSMRKLSHKVLSNPEVPTNVYALIGQNGFVTTEIPTDGRGYVKIGGEEWSAITKTGEPLAAGARITVVALEGNKVIVESKKEAS
jgi:membrane protein implicated in regulation of membrane protease activity